MLNNKGKEIQPTTKGPSRKQAIVPIYYEHWMGLQLLLAMVW